MIDLIVEELARGPLYVFIFLFYVVLYPLAMTLMNIGFLRSPYRSVKNIPEEDLPEVSVLLCAKDEENNISESIEALLQLDYPAEKIHFVLVDDESTDATGKIMDEFASSDPRIIKMSTVDMPDSTLLAKGRAVDWGMTKARGEWVFITDADTLVPSSWIKSMLHSADDKTGIIGGPLTVIDKGTLVSRIEKSIWAFVQMFCIGLSGFDKAFTNLGANMALRRSIYEEAGGLEALESTLADDLALFELSKMKQYDSKYITNLDALVRTEPVESYVELLQQARRWLKGGIIHEGKHRFILALVFTYASFGGLFMLLGWLISFPLFVMFWFGKVIVDMMYIFLQRKRLGVDELMQNYLLFQLHKIIVLSIMPVSLVVKSNITWKGRTY